jgi:hypothetical protein
MYEVQWPAHDVLAFTWAVAEYKGRYGQWPDQLRGAPSRAKALLTALTTDEVVALASRIDLRISNQGCAWSVGGRGVVGYDGSWAGALEGSREFDEAFTWVGLPVVEPDEFGHRRIEF